MTSAVRRGRSVTALGVGSVVAGLLAYVFFVTATRALGSEDAAAVAVLWTYWGFTAAAITFPLQHWITHTVEATGGERAVRAALPRLAAGLVVVAVLTGALAAAAGERLFATGGLAFPALVALVTLGAGLLGVVRGALTARGRFAAVGVNLVLENLTRSLAALAMAVGGLHDPLWFGAALVLGYVVGLLNLRAVLRWDAGGAPTAEGPVAAVGATGFGQLCAQVALTGAPLVLALTAPGRPQDVTALFAGLALFRAPYTVGVALLAPVTGRLTQLWVHGSRASWRRLEVVLGVTAVAGAAAAAAAAWWLGPWLVALVFGADVDLPARVAAGLAAGTVVAMANVVVTVMLLVKARTAVLARAWLAAAAAGAGWMVVAPLSPLADATVLFVLVEVVALAWLGVAQARRDGQG